MKKKVILALLTPIMCLSIGGCGSNVGMKLTYGTYITTDDDSINDATKISKNLLSIRMDKSNPYHNENFLLTIAPTNGCACWAKFQAVLKEFIHDTHYLVYQINCDEFGDDNYGFEFEEGHVTFAIVKSGTILKQYMAHPVLESTQALKAEVNKFVKAPDLYYVDEPFLNELIKTGETTLVEYIKGSCPDCNYVDPNMLWPYLNLNNLTTKMYVIDIDYLNGTDEYEVFKNNYKLSNVYDKEFGYDTGYVPTFQYYERGKLTSMSVVFNDTVARIDDQLKVTNSYYTAERLPNLKYAQSVKTNVLKGLIISEEDVTKWDGQYYWKQDRAAVYHQPLLEAFLKQYTK